MQKKWIIMIVAIIVLICISIIILFTINRNDELTGLWDVDGNTKYEFNGKGNGKIIVPNSEYEFTYTIKNNIVSIDFKNETSTDTKYSFKVSKDSLELKDLEQTNIELKLKKVKE